jgi:hypothetical protein
MNKEKLQIQGIIEHLMGRLQAVRRYSVPTFLIFVALIYGAVFFRIHSLSTTQPTAEQVTSQVKAAHVPHIDQSVVRQLQSLQDNSVSVQALFDQARNNPFQ